ncbi:MAG: hypothetical protein ACK44E_05675 [Anaerolineales bacterium]
MDKKQKKFLLVILLWLFLLGCSAPFWFMRSLPTSPVSVKLEPRLIEVRADQAWHNTGIVLQPGDLLVIRYVSGLWSPWPGGMYDAIGFGGDPKCDCNVLKGVSHAALIGKLNDGLPFFVGDNFRQRVGESGVLYLGINDLRISDNSGALLVQVEVWR